MSKKKNEPVGFVRRVAAPHPTTNNDDYARQILEASKQGVWLVVSHDGWRAATSRLAFEISPFPLPHPTQRGALKALHEELLERATFDRRQSEAELERKSKNEDALRHV